MVDRAYITQRFIGLFVSYFLLHLVIFMTVYKYRRRIYNRVYVYINTESINNAFFLSFIVTIIVICFGIIGIAQNIGGLCLTIFQLLLIFIVLFFIMLHGVISVCWKLKKQPNYFKVFPIFCCCIRWKWMNIFTQVISFWLLYSLPHIIFYLAITFTLNFFCSPFSYLVLLMYLALSGILLWIGNAIFFHLCTSFFPRRCDICRDKTSRRRMFFAIFIAVAINLINLILWGFIAVYFYDRRGQTNYITFLPGLTITLVGWYLSGDLVKLFDMITLSKNEDADNKPHTEYEELNEFSPNESVQHKAHIYSIKGLKRFGAIL